MVSSDGVVFDELPTGLRVTWMGHSTTVIKINGYQVLTDLIWVSLAMPRPGESIEPEALPVLQPWWPDDVPWHTAEQRPFVARGL